MARRTVLIPLGEPTPASHWRVIGAQGLYRQPMLECEVHRNDTKRIEKDGLIQQSNHRLYSELHDVFDHAHRHAICTSLGLEWDYFPLNTGRSWGHPIDGRHHQHQPISIGTGFSGRLIGTYATKDVPRIQYDPEGDIEDGADLEGWLLCRPPKSDSTRENLIRAMRITVIINMWQRYKDERTSINWFKSIQEYEGMPLVPDDEADDRAWAELGESADPLSFLSAFEIQRLFNFTMWTTQESNNTIAINTHNDFALTRVLPMRVVRFGKYPQHFALCQPIGLTDLDTQAVAPRMIRVVVPKTNDQRVGMFMLFDEAVATDLFNGLFELKRTPTSMMAAGVHLDTFTTPSLATSLRLADTPPTVGWLPDHRGGVKRYTFSSAYDYSSHLEAQTEAYSTHDSLFALTDEIDDGADPETFIPTWKDRRPMAVVDYAKPRYPFWSDLLKCKVCNQRVRVLLPSGNDLTYVACPSCKDEQGVSTEHLMNDWKPATAALAVQKGQGETMLE